jgi:hypothetical protein
MQGPEIGLAVDDKGRAMRGFDTEAILRWMEWQVHDSR